MASIRSDQAVADAPLAMPEKHTAPESPKSASPKKQGIFGLLKKKFTHTKDGEAKEGHKSETESESESTPASSGKTAVETTKPVDVSQKNVPPQITTTASLPQNSPAATRSPGLSSEGSSQIFERNVQDPVHRPASPSGAIPSHIQTEDHIPPVLEASTLAITSNRVSPDSVQIVTQRAHQPAAATLSSHPTATSLGSPSPETVSAQNSPQIRASSPIAPPVTNSPYLTDTEHTDDVDKRRLSFISFADVVQAEHAESSITAPTESPDLVPTTQVSPPTQIIASIEGTLRGRSPSPARQQVGSQDMGRSLSSNSSVKGVVNAGREEGLVVETLGQALRRTQSGEFRSEGVAPLSLS